MFVHITTRIEGHPYDDLLVKNGFTGFPTLAILDQEGNVLTKDVGRSVDAMSQAIGGMAVLIDLEKREAAGEEGLEKSLFKARLRLGKIDLVEAKTKLADLEFTDAERKELDSILLGKEMMEWLMDPLGGPDAAMTKVYEAYKAGRRPDSSEQSQSLYYQILLDAAEKAKDAVAFEAAYEVVIPMLKANIAKQKESVPEDQLEEWLKGAAEFIKQYEDRLTQIKKKI